MAPPTALFFPTVAEAPAAPEADATGLLREAEQRHAEVRTARGLIDLEVVGGESAGEAITTTIDFEYARPNTRLVARSVAPTGKQSAELILTEPRTYVKAGKQWLATTPGTRPTEVKWLGVDRLPSYLASADRPGMTGQRDVHGVPCQVIGFDLAPEKLKGLEDLAAFKRAARDGVTIDSHAAEVAVGAEDRMIHQISFELHGQDLGGSKLRFIQQVTVTLWDLNASDIVVQAPAPDDLLDLGDLVAPTATPAPAQYCDGFSVNGRD